MSHIQTDVQRSYSTYSLDILSDNYLWADKLDILQAQQLLLELQNAVLHQDDLKDVQKAKVCQVLAEADKDLIDGSDEFLQLVHVASFTQRVLCGAA